MSIQERIEEIIEQKGFSIRSFASAIGISSQRLGNYIKDRDPDYDTLQKILETFVDVDPEWLLTGKGSMIKYEAIEDNTIIVSDSEGFGVTMVPLFNLDARAGMNKRNEVEYSEGEFVTGYIPFIGAQSDDRCFPVYGDSMISAYPPGSVVLAREVVRWQEYFGFGDVFYVFLKDGRRILKQVLRYDEDPKNYVLCHSLNPNYGDEELPKNMIHSVWKVIKGLTVPGW